jgi:hypothetical protein
MASVVHVSLEGDNCWPELKVDQILSGEVTHVAYLKGGMDSGAPSVTIRGNTKEGKVVFLEISGMNFVRMAAAIRAKCEIDGFYF